MKKIPTLGDAGTGKVSNYCKANPCFNGRYFEVIGGNLFAKFNLETKFASAKIRRIIVICKYFLPKLYEIYRQESLGKSLPPPPLSKINIKRQDSPNGVPLQVNNFHCIMNPIERPKIERLVSNILALLRDGTYTVYDAINLCFRRMNEVIGWLNTNGEILAANEDERISAENDRQTAETARQEAETQREQWYEETKGDTQKKLVIKDGQLVVEVGSDKYVLTGARRVIDGNIDISAGVSGFDRHKNVSNMPVTFELNGFGKAMFSYMAYHLGPLDSIKANGIEVLQNFNHTLEDGYHVYIAKEDGNQTGVKYELDKKNY